MDRRVFGLAGLGIFSAFAATAKTSDAKGNRVAIQVSSDDRHTQGLALGNAQNFIAYHKAKGEPAQVEIVVFGPGYSMVRADMSMMKGDIEELQKSLGASLVISACHNTRQAIAESMGKAPDAILLLPGVEDTPSGIVRLAALQAEGWAYIRP